MGSSRRRKGSPQDDEPDSAGRCGELAHAWRSLGPARDDFEFAPWVRQSTRPLPAAYSFRVQISLTLMSGSPLGEFCRQNRSQVRTSDVRTSEPTAMEGTLKKLALVASAATALICAASLIATPADAKRQAKKPPAAPAAQMAGSPGMGGPQHVGGGPVKTGSMCWKEVDTTHDRGYWSNCPKKK